MEDSGALIGLAIALAGIVATLVTGDGRYDAEPSVVIGILLCAISAVLAVKMHALLIGEPALTADLGTITAVITGSPGVEHLLNLRTEHLGPEQLLVCAKVELSPADGADVVDTIDEIERRIYAAVPATLTCYIEPDRFDPQRADQSWS